MPFDRATFYASLRHGTLFDHGLSQRQVEGTEAILNAWDKSGYTDDRWLAYMLGTTYHETGRAMYPVPEGGRGKGHPYGVPNALGQVGYGRGFVEITWNGPPPKADNYAKADKELGLAGKLIANNDLALEPDIAAQILIRGMVEGWFTHFKLADYLNDHLADYLHARRIVNGMDKAELIAGYALVFFAAIQAAEHKAADKTAAVPSTIPTPSAALKTEASAAPLTPTDVLKSLADSLSPLQTIADTVGSIIPPAGPLPGDSGDQHAATESSIMNPISGMLAGAKIASTALPMLFSVATHLGEHLPDIEAKFADLVAKLEHAYASAKHLDTTSAKADLGAAWVDGMAIYDDIGLPRSLVQQVIGVASKNNAAPGFAAEAASVLGGLVEQLVPGAAIPAAKTA